MKGISVPYLGCFVNGKAISKKLLNCGLHRQRVSTYNNILKLFRVDCMHGVSRSIGWNGLHQKTNKEALCCLVSKIPA